MCNAYIIDNAPFMNIARMTYGTIIVFVAYVVYKAFTADYVCSAYFACIVYALHTRGTQGASYTVHTLYTVSFL